jgi:hypothetical protein
MPGKIYLYTIMLGFLLGDAKNFEDNLANKRITIVGIAQQAKEGAIVISDNGHYYVDGLDEWDEKYCGKKVKVTGRLIVEVHEARSTYPGEFQELVGKKAILKKPKWSLVE